MGGPTARPGSGGWPTIRYYNKETGVDGASYTQKTSMSVCDELGPKGTSQGEEGYVGTGRRLMHVSVFVILEYVCCMCCVV